ncbi:hypothetical protein SASPL_111624 [Salvia splendens]|uniref:inorganic diphosphatase n=1 Tax=Salvia splendens TaxID=180675 RepID=A0A8X8YCT8_SALSN|nr:hypothetical protein SASPL_111624 [Salvia splendens]
MEYAVGNGVTMAQASPFSALLPLSKAHLNVHSFSLPQKNTEPPHLNVPTANVIHFRVSVNSHKASLAVRLLMKGYSLPSRRKQLLLIPGIGPGAPIIFHCVREPVLPGCFLRAKAIGLMPMIDQGEKDDKIIAVCADDPEDLYAEYIVETLRR